MNQCCKWSIGCYISIIEFIKYIFYKKKLLLLKKIEKRLDTKEKMLYLCSVIKKIKNMKTFINLLKNLISDYKCYIYNKRNNIEFITEKDYNNLIDKTKPIIYI